MPAHLTRDGGAPAEPTRTELLLQAENERLRTQLDAAREELRWANDLLDRYGAPKMIYNPHDRVEQPLNIAGRISQLVDPKNEGFAVPQPLVGEEQAARTLVMAQRMADKLLDEAKDTAKTMAREAEARAKRIVKLAVERARKITEGTTQ